MGIIQLRIAPKQGADSTEIDGLQKQVILILENEGVEMDEVFFTPSFVLSFEDETEELDAQSWCDLINKQLISAEGKIIPARDSGEFRKSSFGKSFPEES